MKRKLFAMGAGKALLIVAVMMNCSLAIYSGVGIVSQKNEGLEDPTNKGKAADKFSVDSFDNKLLGKDIAPPSKCFLNNSRSIAILYGQNFIMMNLAILSRLFCRLPEQNA